MLFHVRDELKAEISGVRSELKAEISGLRDEFKTDLSAEISSVRSELKAEISGVRSELKGEIAGLRGEVNSLSHKMTSEFHRLGLLIEEQNARNVFVLDGLRVLFDRQDRIEKQLAKANP